MQPDEHRCSSVSVSRIVSHVLASLLPLLVRLSAEHGASYCAARYAHNIIGLAAVKSPRQLPRKARCKLMLKFCLQYILDPIWSLVASEVCKVSACTAPGTPFATIRNRLAALDARNRHEKGCEYQYQLLLAPFDAADEVHLCFAGGVLPV